MNETLVKFNYPDSVIKSYQHWSVLLRPQQVTLGSLILANHSPAEAFSDLDNHHMIELSAIIKDIENTLTRCFKYDKINYLMLMMIDPHVHFHVIPRYCETREFKSNNFADKAWPGPPNLSHAIEIDSDHHNQLHQHLIEQWTHG